MWSSNTVFMITTLVLIQIWGNHLSFLATAQPFFNSRVCQDTFGNYTTNSTFGKNVQSLLSTLTSDTRIDYGFYNISVGKDLDVVYGIGLCRPDITVQDCQLCLQQAAVEIIKQCPTQKDAIGWYDTCMIRYSIRYIFRKMEFGPWYNYTGKVYGIGDDDADKERYNNTVATLLARLQADAASGDSRYKFGGGTANVTGSTSTVYALVQCTPDLEYTDCYDCIDNAITDALTNSYGQQARIQYTSCGIRFESFSFVNFANLARLMTSSSPSPALAPRTDPPRLAVKGRSKKARLIIVIITIVVSLLLVSTLLGCCFWWKRTRAMCKLETGENIRNLETLQMDFNTVKAATGNFSDGNQIGRGGFGTVYKGKLPNGEEIAVKRLSMNSGQGEEEFKNEALLVSKLRHKNLVRFIGFSLEGEERLLIYELLPNKSLDYFLFDAIKRSHLDWKTRLKIVGGIARGLLYLHEDSSLLVVHRDLKAGNILLDEEMNSKIADFGLARLFGVDQTQGDTSKICGTYGYMPPEYVHQGHFSFKSDVFSFGVLLLEIITGLRISSFHDSQTCETLLSYAWRNWLEDTALNIVDPTMSDVDTAEVLRCINIGLLCVQENLAHRPIMSLVVLMLNNDSVSPSMPSRPAFVLHTNGAASVQLETPALQNYTQVMFAKLSKNEVTISELDPR